MLVPIRMRKGTAVPACPRASAPSTAPLHRDAPAQKWVLIRMRKGTAVPAIIICFDIFVILFTFAFFCFFYCHCDISSCGLLFIFDDICSELFANNG